MARSQVEALIHPLSDQTRYSKAEGVTSECLAVPFSRRLMLPEKQIKAT